MARLIADDQHIELEAVRVVLAKLATLSAAELADEIDIPRRGRGCFRRELPLSPRSCPEFTERIEISRSGIRTGLLLEALYEEEDPPGMIQRRSGCS